MCVYIYIYIYVYSCLFGCWSLQCTSEFWWCLSLNQCRALRKLTATCRWDRRSHWCLWAGNPDVSIKLSLRMYIWAMGLGHSVFRSMEPLTPPMAEQKPWGSGFRGLHLPKLELRRTKSPICQVGLRWVTVGSFPAALCSRRERDGRNTRVY